MVRALQSSKRLLGSVLFTTSYTHIQFESRVWAKESFVCLLVRGLSTTAPHFWSFQALRLNYAQLLVLFLLADALQWLSIRLRLDFSSRYQPHQELIIAVAVLGIFCSMDLVSQLLVLFNNLSRVLCELLSSVLIAFKLLLKIEFLAFFRFEIGSQLNYFLLNLINVLLYL